MNKKTIREERIKQRLKDAYLVGLRARKFTPEQMLKQADEFISFTRKLQKSEVKR